SSQPRRAGPLQDFLPRLVPRPHPRATRAARTIAAADSAGKEPARTMLPGMGANPRARKRGGPSQARPFVSWRRKCRRDRRLAQVEAHLLRGRLAGRLALGALLEAARDGDLVIAGLLEVEDAVALLAAGELRLAHLAAALKAHVDLVKF